MGLLKKLTVRSKRKSVADLGKPVDNEPPRPPRPAAQQHFPGLGELLNPTVPEEDEDDTTPASILIGIDFGTTQVRTHRSPHLC